MKIRLKHAQCRIWDPEKDQKPNHHPCLIKQDDKILCRHPYEERLLCHRICIEMNVTESI